MPPDMSHAEMKAAIEKNRALIEDNNKLLKKMHRNAMFGVWLRVVWYVLLIGLPFALYFYVLEPYFTALGSSFDVFSAGMQEIPGLKQFNEAFNNLNAGQ